MMAYYESAYEKLKDVDAKREKVDLDDFEEFMKKVEEVNKMVHALASNNKSDIEEASRNAAVWLKNQKKKKRENVEISEEIINNPCTGKKANGNVNKTVINDKALQAITLQPCKMKLESLNNLNSPSMSQEDFMRSVEEDAKKRSEDRQNRKTESDAFKIEANKAFLNRDYEKALDLFNKAINIRRDSCILYTNRALTLLHLGLYSRALNDCDTALKLNENSFKAAVFKGKSYFQLGEEEKTKEWMESIKLKFPSRIKEIEEYEESWSAEAEKY